MTQILDILAAWHHDYYECSSLDLNRISAEHARNLGLPTLSALYQALERVQTANGPISRAEVEDLLRGPLQTARGEATNRIRLILGNPNHPGSPGIGIIPEKLLESKQGRRA
jgi:hypothetical protein